jgi:hypothetical protein
MLNRASEVFSIEEVTLENIHLLPEQRRKVIYFVTAMQGENQKILYIGLTYNLSKKFQNHQRKVEFEFLNRMGYQVNILGIVLPDAISQREAQSVHVFYTRVFEPKLNDDYNTFVVIQAEHIKEQFDDSEQNESGYIQTQIKKWEQKRDRYEDLKKQLENLEVSGNEKDAVINKIWEAGKEYLMKEYLMADI